MTLEDIVGPEKPKKDYEIIYGNPLMGNKAIIKSIKRHIKKDIPKFMGHGGREYMAVNQVLPTVIRYEHAMRKIYL